MITIDRSERIMTSHEPRIDCAQHLMTALMPSRLRKALAVSVKFLKTKDFDAIAFRGLSGSLFAPILALRLKKTLLAVRKGEDSHSSQMVEGDFAAKRYIIVDDFIAGGSTVYNIMKEIHSELKGRAECVGFFGYNRAWKNVTVSDWRNVGELDQYCRRHGTLYECGRGEGRALLDVPVVPDKPTSIVPDLSEMFQNQVSYKFRYASILDGIKFFNAAGEEIAKPDASVSGVESPQLETPPATD